VSVPCYSNPRALATLVPPSHQFPYRVAVRTLAACTDGCLHYHTVPMAMLYSFHLSSVCSVLQSRNHVYVLFALNPVTL
jgi:hypothetical protein